MDIVDNYCYAKEEVRFFIAAILRSWRDAG